MGGYKKHFGFFFLFLLNSFVCFGQSEVDSLKNKSFDELKVKFYKHEKAKGLAIVYAKTYLSRAKKINDTIKIANGFYFLSCLSKDSLFLSYNDSIINLTKNLKKENKFYPIIGYFKKGDYFYSKRDFSLALKNYLLAHESKINAKNEGYMFDLKYRIGLLKSRYGNDKDALALFKDIYKHHIKKKYNDTQPSYYLPILYALSYSYLRNGLLDSSYYFNKKGYFLIEFCSLFQAINSFFRPNQYLFSLSFSVGIAIFSMKSNC